jgi:Icc-related predicted phosphoesterase
MIYYRDVRREAVMKLNWISDPHLNFVNMRDREKFYSTLEDCNGIIITGDIGDSRDYATYLLEMKGYLNLPLYFILGNHDYYHSNIKTVRARAEELMVNNEGIYYLTLGKYHIEPVPGTFLIGVDGWGDAKAGDFKNTKVRLNDSVLIENLRFAEHFGGAAGLQGMMHNLAELDNDNLYQQVLNTIQYANDNTILVKKIIIATHVPPYAECTMYQDRPTSPDFLPFFCNASLGETLDELAKIYTDVQFEVLCGHTHNKAYYERGKNIKVRVGGAQYYSPELTGNIEF